MYIVKNTHRYISAAYDGASLHSSSTSLRRVASPYTSRRPLPGSMTRRGVGVQGMHLILRR
jgi:hypothetical protein